MGEPDETSDILLELQEACFCENVCIFPGVIDLALSSREMSESERVSTVHAMMLALASPSELGNQLLKYSTKPYETRSADSTKTEWVPDPKNITICYALKGRRVCRGIFSTVTHSTTNLISRQARGVCNSYTFNIYQTKRGAHRKGRISQQSSIACAFLERYAELNGFPCPSGQGSNQNQFLRLLPSCTKYKSVHGILYAMLLLKLDHFILSRQALSVLFSLEMYSEIILDN